MPGLTCRHIQKSVLIINQQIRLLVHGFLDLKGPNDHEASLDRMLGTDHELNQLKVPVLGFPKQRDMVGGVHVEAFLGFDVLLEEPVVVAGVEIRHDVLDVLA